LLKRESKIKVSDNSGAKVVQCIGFFKNIKCDTAYLNEFVIVCLKKLDKKKFLAVKNRGKTIKKQKIDENVNLFKNIYRALILSSKKKTKRLDGSFIKTKDNRVVLVSTD